MIARIIICQVLNLVFKCAALYAAYCVFGLWAVTAWFFVQWYINWLTLVDTTALLCNVEE